MYIELPTVPGTPDTRIEALRESRTLLKGDPKVSSPAIFGGGATEPGPVAPSEELINLATYIETGHAYKDLHPTGKKRPRVINAHVHVMGSPSEEDMEHLLHHLNEDLPEFLKEAERQERERRDQSEKADDEESNLDG
jgi:hypothetical protein